MKGVNKAIKFRAHLSVGGGVRRAFALLRESFRWRLSSTCGVLIPSAPGFGLRIPPRTTNTDSVCLPLKLAEASPRPLHPCLDLLYPAILRIVRFLRMRTKGRFVED
jgi:hypothetical protein